jgi:hypothetical protein
VIFDKYKNSNDCGKTAVAEQFLTFLAYSFNPHHKMMNSDYTIKRYFYYKGTYLDYRI